MKKKQIIGVAIWIMLWNFVYAQDAYWLEPRVNTDPSFTYTPSPEDWRDINVYQMFTDRFFDGDASNNNIRTMRNGTGWYGENTNGNSWYNTGNSSNANERHLVQGGDWEGIRQQIPYLNAMGIKAVWISSVQKNEQGVDKRYTPYHSYHPTDLYRCEPLFGDFAKLKQTIDELHANGIYVILDVVPNHMADLVRRNDGNESSYFEHCSSFDINWVEGLTHAWPFDNLDWIHCNGQINNYDSYPETQLGSFRGTDDLNTDRQDVKDALDAAFKNLIDATDCDGFRVDAIKHVDHDWIKDWASSMRGHAAFRGKDDFIVFGELFSYDDGAHTFFTQEQGSGFNSVMWFTMMQTLKNVFSSGGGTNQLTGQLNNVHNNGGFGEGGERAITFMDNHDVDRIGLHHGSSWPDLLRPAVGLLYCAAPVPTILYGTEHGFDQGGNRNNGIDDGDYQRECMMDYGYQWGNANGDKFSSSSEIKDLIGQLNAARAQYTCLTRGNFTARYESSVYAFTRALDDQEALVALNTDWGSQQSANPQVGKADGTVFTNYLDPSETLTVSGGQLNVTVPARGLKVFIAGPPNLVVSNTRNWPIDGDVDSGEDVWIDADTSPKSIAVSGQIIWSTDGGTTWSVEDFGRNEDFDGANTDAWNVNIGSFTADTEVQYAVNFTDGDGSTVWDSNEGSNYTFTVNSGGGGPALTWVGNDTTTPCEEVTATGGGGGTTPEPTIDLSISGTTVSVNLGNLQNGLDYIIEESTDLATWATAYTYTAAATTYQWADAESTTADTSQFYRVRYPTTMSGTSIHATTETYAQGVAVTVNLIYTTDDWASSTVVPMVKTRTAGNNDVWEATFGNFDPGTTVTYYIVAADSEGNTQDDNNAGNNHTCTIIDPNAPDITDPVASHSPASTTTTAATLDITLSATDDRDANLVIYYTTDATNPDLTSAVYASPIRITDAGAGVDAVVKYFAVDAAGNQSPIITVEVKVNEDPGTFGSTTPYSTNPTLGKAATITIDGTNTGGEWGDDNLIAIDKAGDDPRSLGSNWTMHETPTDFTHLWASWDDDNLYIAWQMVDITDVIDPSNAGSGDPISNQQILAWIAIDTKAGGAAEDMWGKPNAPSVVSTFGGTDIPDYQLYVRLDMWAGAQYIARAKPDGTFGKDPDLGVDYFDFASAGVVGAHSASLVPTQLMGVRDADDRNGTSDVNFLSEGHTRTDRDGFYEIKIPLSILQITRAQLESDGLGIKVGSQLDSVPHDETTVDLPGVEVYNSSFEWADADIHTTNFARVGSF